MSVALNRRAYLHANDALIERDQQHFSCRHGMLLLLFFLLHLLLHAFPLVIPSITTRTA